MVLFTQPVRLNWHVPDMDGPGSARPQPAGLDRLGDASCRVEALVHPGFYGRDLAAECQREAVTAWALDLRRIATMAREARR